MKWLLIIITLSITDGDTCNQPGTLVKHGDEIFDSKEECEKSFAASSFYQTKYKQEVVGFCVGPFKPLYLSPQQLAGKIERPKCP